MLFFHRCCFVAAIATTVTSIVDQSESLALHITTTKSDALILGGILTSGVRLRRLCYRTESGGCRGEYMPIVTLLLLASDSSLIHLTTGLFWLVIHPRAQKQLQRGMAGLKRAIPCIRN
jgi:hypothetical protein